MLAGILTNMKKENLTDSNITVLEEKLKESKLKLLNLRSDIENRKVKNVKEKGQVKKEVARILFTIGMKNKEVILATKLSEDKKE